MPKPQPTARERLERAMHVSFKLPEQAAELLDAYRDEVIAQFAQDDAREVLARHRDQVLTEAAELIRDHRGDLNDDSPWWDTRDRDTAARLLLAARTAQGPR